MKIKEKSINEQAQKLLEDRGSSALEMARNVVHQEKVKSKEVREALSYFMTEYWCDIARPTILSVACESVGGDFRSATEATVPLILVSGGADIHDDIIDKSKVKYGRPTVYGKFGGEIALLAGDALLFKGLTMLNTSFELVPEVIDIIKTMFFELGSAEASELQLRGKKTVAAETYLEIVRMKAADVEAYTRIGAMLGGGTRGQIDALGKYGRILGSIAILVDDLADIADHLELSNRIQNEVLPLPLLLALNQPRIGSTLNSLLFKEKIKKTDAEKIFEVISKTTAIKDFLDIISNMHVLAYSYIERIPFKKNLRLLLDSLVSSIDVLRTKT